jgi:hypothetical protein
VLQGDYAYMVYPFSADEVEWVGDTLDVEMYLSKFNYVTWNEEDYTWIPTTAMAGEQRWSGIMQMELDMNNDIVLLFIVQDDEFTDNNPNNDFVKTHFSKIDLEGNVIWEHELIWPDLPFINDARIENFVQMPNEGFVLSGRIYSNQQEYLQKHWMIMTDPCGEVIYNGCTNNLNDLYNNQSNYSLYPNPSSDQLNIAFSNNSLSYYISIFDLQGKLLLSACVKPYQDTKTIDVSKFESGVYMLQLMSENGSSDIMKWMKE